MAHKPRPKRDASIDDILAASASAGPAAGRRAAGRGASGAVGAGRGGAAGVGRGRAPAMPSVGRGRPRAGQIYGEVADPIVQAELSAMKGVDRRDESWHIFGQDKVLTFPLLSFPPRTHIYTYTHIHIYTHTYTHTHSLFFLQPPPLMLPFVAKWFTALSPFPHSLSLPVSLPPKNLKQWPPQSRRA